MRPELVARGVDFIPNQAAAPARLRHGARAQAAWNRVPPLRGPMAAAGCWREHLDPLRAGPGNPGPLGGEADRRLAACLRRADLPAGSQRIVPLLATLGRRAEVTLFLSIRSFDTQLPSAYVQELRYMPPIAGGFDNIRRRVLARPPSWFELVRRIRAAAPGMPLRVWRQEDYRDNTAAILAARSAGWTARAAAGDRGSGLDQVARASRRSAPPRRCRPTARARAAGAGAGDLPRRRRRRAARASSRSPTPSGGCCRRPTPPTSSGSPRSTRSADPVLRPRF